jgi:hypothetical protein
MTPEERNVLQQFLSDLASTGGVAKDPEADGMINQAIRANPDSAYLLVQHAILADQALQAAQGRIQALEQGQAQGQPPASFLGGGQSQPPAPYEGPSQGYAPQQPPPQLQSPLSPSSGLGGFLRTAGTMAAGVAGGDFLAQGLSNLFSPRDW